MPLSKLYLIADDPAVLHPKYSFPPETIQKIKERFVHVTENMLDGLAQELGILRDAVDSALASERKKQEETPCLNDGMTGGELREILDATKRLTALLCGCNRRTSGLLDSGYAFNKTAPRINNRALPTLDDVIQVLGCFYDSCFDDSGNGSDHIRNLLVTGKGRRKGADSLRPQILEAINGIIYSDGNLLSKDDAMCLIEILNLQITEAYVKQWLKGIGTVDRHNALQLHRILNKTE